MKDQASDWNALVEDCFEHPEEHEVLNRFFEAILPYVRAALTSRYSGDFSLVEDALQSAFVKYLAIFQKTPKRPLTVGYFIVVAKNCLIDQLRRRKGHLPIDEIVDSELQTTVRAADEFDDRMLLLQYAMTLLDSRCQFILESYYVDEIDSVKIAQWLKIAPDSVHMAIKRCRDRLRTVLADLSLWQR